MALAPATDIFADEITSLVNAIDDSAERFILALLRKRGRDGAAKPPVGSGRAATDAVTIGRVVVVIVGNWIGAPRETCVDRFEEFYVRVIDFRWISAFDGATGTPSSPHIPRPCTFCIEDSLHPLSSLINVPYHVTAPVPCLRSWHKDVREGSFVW